VISDSPLGICRAGPAGVDHRGDAATRAEITVDMGPDRVAGFDHVFEDLVDNVFLEDAEVAVREQVLFPGLELEAAFAGHIAELNNTEIGQAGLRADGSKFGIVDQNFIGRELILPGFNGGEIEFEAGLGMLFGIAGDSSVGNGCHIEIL
jgi:hypothetical protein